MKLNHQLTPYTKINSRWIKDLNISRDTIKVLEENIGRKISGIQCRSIFTAMSPRAWDIKERINNGTSSKYKASAQLENTALNERRTNGMGKHTLTFMREQSGAVHCPPLHQEAHNIGIFLFVFL